MPAPPPERNPSEAVLADLVQLPRRHHDGADEVVPRQSVTIVCASEHPLFWPAPQSGCAVRDQRGRSGWLWSCLEENTSSHPVSAGAVGRW